MDINAELRKIERKLEQIKSELANQDQAYLLVCAEILITKLQLRIHNDERKSACQRRQKTKATSS